MRNALTLLLLFLFSFCYSQKITLSGIVLDKETREALTFCSIGIKGKTIGTISNLQGQFDFHMPNEYRNDILTITMLGYLSFEAPVWSILESNPSVIEMKRSTLVLNEVIISDSLDGGEILQIALARVENNYPMLPFMADAFYRDIKKIGGTFVSVLEAAVKIYDEDYKEPRNKFKLRERVKLVEVRRSLGYENKFTGYFDEGNLLEDLLLNNNIRYRQFPEDEIFFNGLKREKDSYYNDRAIYVISFSDDYSLKIFIDKESYSVIHLEYENQRISPMTKKSGMKSRFVGLKRVIDFKEYGGRMYLNFLAVESKINWYDAKTDELKFETELHQQLLINEIKPNTNERIGTTEKMKSYGLQYQDQPYNQSFWDNYNVIKQTPLDKKIIEDLEKQLMLAQEYEEN
jgi:hypothetical protein